MNKTRLRKIIVTAVIVIAVLVYDISPLDIIPDIAAGIGQLDDIGVTAAGIIGVIANLLISKSNKGAGDFKDIID